MPDLSAPDYEVARFLIERGLAAIPFRHAASLLVGPIRLRR